MTLFYVQQLGRPLHCGKVYDFWPSPLLKVFLLRFLADRDPFEAGPRPATGPFFVFDFNGVAHFGRDVAFFPASATSNSAWTFSASSYLSKMACIPRKHHHHSDVTMFFVCLQCKTQFNRSFKKTQLQQLRARRAVSGLQIDRHRWGAWLCRRQRH